MAIMSKPQCLMPGAKEPPQLASPIPPVDGDFVMTIQRPMMVAPVHVMMPVVKHTTFSGLMGSAPAGMWL